MLSSNRIFSALMVLLLGVMACNTGEVIPISTLEPNAIGTLIAGTVISALTQSAVPDISLKTPALTDSPTSSLTPEPPTFTPTVTLTPTITLTPTPLVPLVSVSVATNCRKGPGKVYDYQGALLVGEVAQVFGRDPSGNYWYIRNPDSSGNDYCWLWGNYATVTGNFAVLPVYTPPPTPTPTFTPTPPPSFKVSYSSLDTCTTNWWLELKIRNDGSLPFKSVSVRMRDLVTNVLVVDLSDGFTDIDGCLKTTTKDVIAPGATYLLSGPPFNYNPTGNKVRVTITLCSGLGQKGTCVYDRFEVTP